MRAMTPDSTMQRFLVDGYITVTPQSLGDDYHSSLWQEANKLYEQSRLLQSPTAHLQMLGDNLRAQIPAVDRLLEDPAIVETITNILGEDAFLHPHHYVHEALESDQPFHQDGNLPWNERGHYRSHRPDWLILFYYPQAVTLTNGPTEIVPGSQYWTTDIERANGNWRRGDLIDDKPRREELRGDDLDLRDRILTRSLTKLGIPNVQRRFIQVPKGTVVIGNYDLIHRGSRTATPDTPRYMFKFYYARTREPQAPAKRGRRRQQAPQPELSAVRPDLQPVVLYNWLWWSGERHRHKLNKKALADASTDLQQGSENLRVAAAYHLGADTGEASLGVLLTGLHHTTEGVRRASAYGLRLRSDEAGEALIAATADPRPSVRRFAVFALGASWSPGFSTLLECIANEEDDLARSNAAYALGQVVRSARVDARAACRVLVERLQPGVEPDNTDVAGLPRSTVRQSVAYAILQLAVNHKLTDTERQALMRLVEQERDRYVTGMLYEALARTSPDARLIRAVTARRWHAI